jgi:hypothetical protein
MRLLHYLIKAVGTLVILISISCDESEPGAPDSIKPTDSEPRDYLQFDNATKHTGDYPTAADGTLKINIRDTMYVIDNHPYRARISVLHEASVDISGFYVWVTGTTEQSYYDVPAVAAEGKDTVDVVYIGFDPKEEVVLPYSVKIIIQPHAADGTALDEFERTISVEEADQSACTITAGRNRWQWLYTEMYNYQGELYQVTAPWFQATLLGESGYYYAKCCIEDPDFGTIEAYPGEPTREGICQFGNPLYKRVFIDGTYYLKAYDELFLFEEGEFWHYSASLTSNFIPQKSRICDLFAYYELDYTAFEKIGHHDYEPGDSQVKLTTDTAFPPFGPIPPSGDFINSCHLLIFTTGSEETYKIVYQKQPDGTEPATYDPVDYLDVWFPQ